MSVSKATKPISRKPKIDIAQKIKNLKQELELMELELKEQKLKKEIQLLNKEKKSTVKQPKNLVDEILPEFIDSNISNKKYELKKLHKSKIAIEKP